jgi:RimJ/RimL family protein N-acetyltransferase
MADIHSLHALSCQPLVYRYLFDGIAPDRDFIADRVAQAVATMVTPGLGMWVLTNPPAPCVGCVELRPYPSSRTAEVTYLLHPDHWDRGLATAMAWTVISQAFRSPHIDCVVAGHDLPNAASLAVMRRLGMRFHRNVRYPLGAGAEYILHRDDPRPVPRPTLIPLR